MIVTIISYALLAFFCCPRSLAGEQKKFCYVNSKSARKKLVAALFAVPRQALDLLPMYARLVAILDKVCIYMCIIHMIRDETEKKRYRSLCCCCYCSNCSTISPAQLELLLLL